MSPQRSAAHSGKSPTAGSRRLRVLGLAGLLLAAGTTACTSSSDDGKSSPAASPTAVQGSFASPAAPTLSGVGRATSTPTRSRLTTAPASDGPKQRTKPPVRLRAPATFGAGVVGSITKIRSVRAKATLPGEISGPALAITIRIDNGSDRRLDLGNAVVNLAYGAARTPAAPVNAAPADPLTGALAAGATATAVYVFTVPTAHQDDRLTVDVSYSAKAPAVVFSGRRN